MPHLPCPSEAAPSRAGASAAMLLVVVALLAGCQPAPPAIVAIPIGAEGVGVPGLPAAPLPPLEVNAPPGFVLALVPSAPTPLPLGQALRVRLSSSLGGFAQLYLFQSGGQVVLLAENLPLPPGEQLVVPRPSDGFMLQARPPAGVERFVLLVTRQPYAGFGAAPGVTVTRPMVLNATAETVIGQINLRARALPRDAWASTELRIQTIAAGN